MEKLRELLKLSGWEESQKDDGDVFYTHPHSKVDYRFPSAAMLILYSLRTVKPPQQVMKLCKDAFEEAMSFLKEYGWELDGHQVFDPEYSSQYSYEMEEALFTQLIRTEHLKLLNDQRRYDPPSLN